jgi:hypothetical protein
MGVHRIFVPYFGTVFGENVTLHGAVYPHLGVSAHFRAAYVPKFGNDYQIAYAGNACDMAVMLGRLFNRSAAAGG